LAFRCRYGSPGPSPELARGALPGNWGGGLVARVRVQPKGYGGSGRRTRGHAFQKHPFMNQGGGGGERTCAGFPSVPRNRAGRFCFGLRGNRYSPGGVIHFRPGIGKRTGEPASGPWRPTRTSIPIVPFRASVPGRPDLVSANQKNGLRDPGHVKGGKKGLGNQSPGSGFKKKLNRAKAFGQLLLVPGSRA